ncbi:MAG: tetratricopeptide repeat protein [Burkholderiales bacterium]|nr:tetratricopeptide repeat protein [Burkholderiales bacterium]
MRRLVAFFLAFQCLVAAIAAAQSAPPAPPAAAPDAAVAIPRELTEAGRKAYAESLKVARARIDDKQYAAAIEILDQLTAERPREPQARFLKGLALADSGKTDEAIATYRGIIAEYPELPEPHNNLAVLLAQKGEYELARAELETAIAAAPDYAVAYENLGDIHAQLAAVAYEKAIAHDVRNKTAPVKLKLVREALAPPSATTPPIVAAPPSSAAPAAPSK